MAVTFDSILAKGIRAGQVPARTQSARKWFRGAAQRTKITDSKLMSEAGDRMKSQFTVGRMYFYHYDPKHKKTLPYYDTFPLIFPIGPAKGGFMGINMHYLPYTLRARLMDALYDVTNNNKFNESTKLQLSYQVLQGASKMRWFKPTLKHYLRKNVRSKFMRIEASEWDIALFLPVHQFQKASAKKVWADSRKSL
jgi:hypothetical protein|tara:strand:- start:564 stop:1148 length:585 start_codon:yes stop_codon:yes gene_type:complete